MSNLLQKLMAKIQVTDTGCWQWLGATAGGGYGTCYFDGHMRPVHRLLYKQIIGKIPDGLDLDHLCRNRRCVNPEHLEPVTRRENLLRSPITLTTLKAAQTHCIRGHEFIPENTIIRKIDGTRHCRICKRKRERRKYVPIPPKTHCAQGHEFTPENTIIIKANGRRRCRECSRKTQREWHRARRKAKAVV